MAYRVGKLALLGLDRPRSGRGARVRRAPSRRPRERTRAITSASTAAQKLSHAQAGRSIQCLLNRARHRHGLRAAPRQRASGAGGPAAHELHEAPPLLLAQLPGGAVVCRPAQARPLHRERPEVLERGGEHRVGRRQRRDAQGDRQVVDAQPPAPGEHPQPRSSDHLGVGFARGLPGGKQGDGGMYTTDFGMRQALTEAAWRASGRRRPNL